MIYRRGLMASGAPAERCISDTDIHLTLNGWPVRTWLIVVVAPQVDNYPESRLTTVQLMTDGAAGSVLTT